MEYETKLFSIGSPALIGESGTGTGFQSSGLRSGVPSGSPMNVYAGAGVDEARRSRAARSMKDWRDGGGMVGYEVWLKECKGQEGTKEADMYKKRLINFALSKNKLRNRSVPPILYPHILPYLLFKVVVCDIVAHHSQLSDAPSVPGVWSMGAADKGIYGMCLPALRTKGNGSPRYLLCTRSLGR